MFPEIRTGSIRGAWTAFECSLHQPTRIVSLGSPQPACEADREYQDEGSGKYEVQQRHSRIHPYAVKKLVADRNVTEQDAVNDEKESLEAKASGNRRGRQPD